MKIISKLSFIFLGVLLLAACSPVHVIQTEPSSGFSLNNYKTFGFYEVDASGNSVGQDFSQSINLIKEEVAKQLEARGLTRTTTNPDLLVNLGLVVNNKNLTRQTRFGQDGPYYVGQRRYTWKSQEVVVDRYKQGTVSVHLVDRAQNQMVWHGEAESVVPNKPEKLKERIAEGAQRLFSSLPTKTNN